MAKPIRYVDARAFKQAVKAEQPTDDMAILKTGAFAIDAKGIDVANRIIPFVISTPMVDREGDTISVAGWDLKFFDLNPVVLWAHDHHMLPVGRSVRHYVENRELRSLAQFTPKELNPFGFMTFELYQHGYMKATSVGFRPYEFRFAEDREYGVDFVRQELLEYSAVPVPCNAEALIQARAKGIDVVPMKHWAERTLDLLKQPEKGCAPDDARCNLERLRAIADPAGRKLIVALGEVKMPRDAATRLERLEARRTDEVAPETPTTEIVRWNPRRSKAFDVSREQLSPASTEQALCAKYLDVEMKLLERQAACVPSVRMGQWLRAIADLMDEEGWQVDDLRNLDWQSKETVPLYELIELNSTLSQDFLVDGIRFMRHEVGDDGEERASLRVQPRWYGMDVTTYGVREAGTAARMIQAIAARAAELKFLKGEAFSLSGQFLPKGDETWDDLFLDQKNAAAMKRVVTLINAKGESIDNRGMILCGPPGTGKTLSGRIVRNEARATLIWVASRDFHYAGGFGGVTSAFDLARELAPSVVIFEDIDNWLSETTVDLLKSEMDGMARTRGVVTILTTNFPELLPKALIDRPGRFHDVLRFGLPDDAARAAMVARWMPDLGPESAQAAVAATAGYSGAHMRELAKFAEIIGEQDGLDLDKAVIAALEKLKEQRELITAVQMAGSRYRAPTQIASRQASPAERLGAIAGARAAAAAVEKTGAAAVQVVVDGALRGKQLADGEEEAELIQFQAIGTLADALTALAAQLKAQVDALVAAEVTEPVVTAEGEAAEEAVEGARLSVICSLVAQCEGVLSGIEQIAYGCMNDADVDDGTDVLLPYGSAALALRLAAISVQSMAVRGKAGARHSAADMRMIQEAHDKIVALGAACAKEDPEPAAAPAAMTEAAAAPLGVEKDEIDVEDDSAIEFDEDEEIGDLDVDEIRAAIEGAARTRLMELTGRLD